MTNYEKIKNMSVEYEITQENFNDKITNPYFIAFIKDKKLKIGDKYKPFEFMKWVDEKQDKYQEEKSNQTFTEWLNKEVSE